MYWTCILTFLTILTDTSMTCSGQVLPSGVVWPFILLLLFPRSVAMGVAVYLMLRPKHYLLQPTILAKVFLGVATVLSLMEDIPNSVVTIAPRHAVWVGYSTVQLEHESTCTWLLCDILYCLKYDVITIIKCAWWCILLASSPGPTRFFNDAG